MPPNEKKCNCALGNKIFCKNCSKVKMVILLKNGYDCFKIETPSGFLANPAWYSVLKYNNRSVYQIAEKMEAAFRKYKLVSATNVLQFYITENPDHPFLTIKL